MTLCRVTWPRSHVQSRETPLSFFLRLVFLCLFNVYLGIQDIFCFAVFHSSGILGCIDIYASIYIYTYMFILESGGSEPVAYLQLDAPSTLEYQE